MTLSRRPCHEITTTTTTTLTWGRRQYCWVLELDNWWIWNHHRWTKELGGDYENLLFSLNFPFMGRYSPIRILLLSPRAIYRCGSCMCHEWILFSPRIANQDSVGFNSILQPQLFVHPDWVDVVYPGGEKAWICHGQWFSIQSIWQTIKNMAYMISKYGVYD